MPVISLKNVSKIYSVKDREKNGNQRDIRAIDNVSLEIKRGEFVGLIGNNGAGKSTLIKMISGILYNTEGSLELLGKDPFKNRIENNKNISVVFGQKSQLNWDLSPMDSFYLLQAIYEVDQDDFEKNIGIFTKLFEMTSFLDQPVRTLSLGQKMKCEVAAAFLHNPKVVFLDEPTIGLDIFSKENIADFLMEMKLRKDTTLILTTHDMDEISQICDRIVCLDKGEIILDRGIDQVRDMRSNKVSYLINTENKNPVEIDREKISYQPYKIHIKNIDEEETGDYLQEVFAKNKVIDIAREEESFTDIVKKIYGGGRDLD